MVAADRLKPSKSNNQAQKDIARLVKERDCLAGKLQISTERLKSLELDVETARKSLREFTNASYHTMMEPIRIATIYADMLRIKKGGWNNEVRPYLLVIEDCHKRLYNITKKLQEYAIVSNPLNLCEIDLNDLVDKVVDGFSQQLKDVGGSITVEQLCNVKADSMHMSLLYQNIIENALLYHDKNRRLHIQIGMKKKDEPIFFIKDNGLGVESKYCREIFSFFTQINTYTKHAGSGLGLALCKCIVEKYSGKIWAQSNLGSGSIFYFTLNSPVNTDLTCNQHSCKLSQM